jgi:hypothetical protein
MTIKNVFNATCRKIGAMVVAPSSRQMQSMLFLLGLAVLTIGIHADANAAYSAAASYNDDRVAEATDVIFTYLTGSFGALIMIACGVGAILSSAFGQYRAALGLMVVAVGSFILRSLVATWFNDTSMVYSK